MSYFNSDFNQFFIELAANNHKDWFDTNRSRYEKSVKKPFEQFVTALIAEMKNDEPKIEMEAKHAIFRINRDVRFSKDKSPYKLNRSAAVSKYGKKDGARPGLYFQLGPEHVVVAGGVYQPEPAQLKALREAIAENPKKFRSAIDEKDFKNYFGDLKGDRAKRLNDKSLMEQAASEPYILNKQLYYWAELPPEEVTSPKLLDTILKRHRAAAKYRAFLEDVLT